jgi:hypothetical protein
MLLNEKLNVLLTPGIDVLLPLRLGPQKVSRPLPVHEYTLQETRHTSAAAHGVNDVISTFLYAHRCQVTVQCIA